MNFRGGSGYRPLGWKERWCPGIVCFIALIGWVLAGVFLYFWLAAPSKPIQFPVSESWLARFHHGAVAADNGQCSEIGRDALRLGGNAVDAAIAALVCNGVHNAHSMGLGGGFFMVVYNSSTKESYTLNAREMSPAATAPDKFNFTLGEHKKGWKSIAIPGEVKGYWEAHKRWGKLEWKRLWSPTVEMLRNGYVLHEALAGALSSDRMIDRIKAEPLMNIYINHDTEKVFEEGDIIRDKVLALTLSKIAESPEPARLFYQGDLTKTFVEEIQKNGGLLTEEDFADYEVEIEKAWTASLGQNSIHTLTMPSGGPAVAMYLRIMQKIGLDAEKLSKDLDYQVKAYHYMIEAMKYSYNYWELFEDSNSSTIQKMLKDIRNDSVITKYADDILNREGPISETELRQLLVEDPTKENIEEGGETAHISVIDGEGNMVSVTSSINWYLGSLKRSPTTGILWNNHMADFALQGPTNVIGPRKRPRSAMSPILVTGDSILSTGASGGSKIVAAVGYVAGRILLLNETLKAASDAPRVYARLKNGEVALEPNFPQTLKSKLSSMGHNFGPPTGKSVIQSVSVSGKNYFAHSDHRKGGYPAGI